MRRPRSKSRAAAAVLEPVASALERLAIAPGSTILGAISGGPDSVALFHALVSLQPNFGFRLVAGHLNHGLRGAESDRDENLVRDLCAKRAVDLLCERVETLTSNLPNLEERARYLRYQFLNRAAERTNARYIALAHQADDQAETVMMRLLRGAGAAGIGAMAERGPGRLFRPMLAVTRAQVIAYLDNLGASWIVDSTNTVPISLRNRLRLELLPLIESQFAPGFAARLTALAAEMRALDRFVTAAARAEMYRRRSHDELNIANFDRLDSALAQAALREFIRDRIGGLRRISRAHLVAALRMCVGRHPSGSVGLPGRWQLQREYQVVRLTPISDVAAEDADAASFRVQLTERGTTVVEPSGFIFETQIIEWRSGTPLLPRDSMEAFFDADQTGSRLTVRSAVPGDRIAPYGLEGTRKLQDVLVDGKLPRQHRLRWPLVTANDRILWIPGYVRSRHALITPTTTRIRRVRLTPSEALEKSTLRKKCCA